MKYEIEVDFTNQIKATSLDAMAYIETPEVFLKTAHDNKNRHQQIHGTISKYIIISNERNGGTI